MDDEDEVDIVGEFNEELIAPAVNSYEEMGLSINELLPYLGPNSWLLNTDQVWNLDASIDDKSKASVEKCLSEERTVNSSLIFSNEIKTLSSTSHKKPWTESEKEMFQKGMKTYGHSWTKISKFIGTRTTLQVKNFARQYLKHVAEKNPSLSAVDQSELCTDRDLVDGSLPVISDQVYRTGKPTVLHVEMKPAKRSPLESKVTPGRKHDSTPMLSDLDSKKSPTRTKKPVVVPSKEIVRIHKESASSESEDIDIEDFNEHSQKLLSKGQIATELTLADSKSGLAEVRSLNCSVANEISDVKAATELPCLPLAEKKVSDADDHQLTSAVKTVDVYDNDDIDYTESPDRASEMYSMDQESRRVFDLPLPEEEVVLERDAVTGEEKVVHQEFFEGRPQKTPERYLKIRNYILDSWEKSKPTYLNKTSVRPGLKNCGDVNCIGRIHTYLEQIGAINFGCEQTVYSRPLVLLGRSLPTTKKASSGTNLAHQFARIETMRPRKRKIPVLTYDSEGGGYTIKHGEDGEIIDVTEGLDSPTPTQKRIKVGDDPFKLILCSEFSTETPAPFMILVHVGAIMVMDVHAHLSALEVIGLLGGHYDRERSLLHVIIAEPCESLSTGLECEMDPVSQTHASERLQEEGYSVVGWYHSHPTFAPNPSVRDLDTQAKFQEWFSQGGAPFLGVIVSPQLQSSPVSKIRYMIVGEEHVSPEGYRKPYRFTPQLFNCNNDVEELLPNMLKLMRKWQAGQSASGTKTSIATLNKMLSSIHHHLAHAQVDQAVVLTVLSEFGKILVAHLAADKAAAEQGSDTCKDSVAEQQTDTGSSSNRCSAV